MKAKGGFDAENLTVKPFKFTKDNAHKLLYNQPVAGSWVLEQNYQKRYISII